MGIEVLGQDGVKPKLALFNPMVEAMIKKARHTHIRLGLLLAQRFCLRAQHYLATNRVFAISPEFFFCCVQFPSSIFNTKCC